MVADRASPWDVSLRFKSSWKDKYENISELSSVESLSKTQGPDLCTLVWILSAVSSSERNMAGTSLDPNRAEAQVSSSLQRLTTVLEFESSLKMASRSVAEGIAQGSA